MKFLKTVPYLHQPTKVELQNESCMAARQISLIRITIMYGEKKYSFTVELMLQATVQKGKQPVSK